MDRILLYQQITELNKFRGKIIKPFVQVDQKESGFGLGLAICKKVLEAHKGYLKIKNNKDEGCTFIACFPIIA